MRCAVPVRKRSLTIRSSEDPSPHCQRWGSEQIGRTWVCWQHARIHYRILERIRSIPERNPR